MEYSWASTRRNYAMEYNTEKLDDPFETLYRQPKQVSQPLSRGLVGRSPLPFYA